MSTKNHVSLLFLDKYINILNKDPEISSIATITSIELNLNVDYITVSETQCDGTQVFGPIITVVVNHSKFEDYYDEIGGSSSAYDPSDKFIELLETYFITNVKCAKLLHNTPESTRTKTIFLCNYWFVQPLNITVQEAFIVFNQMSSKFTTENDYSDDYYLNNYLEVHHL